MAIKHYRFNGVDRKYDKKAKYVCVLPEVMFRFFQQICNLNEFLNEFMMIWDISSTVEVQLSFSVLMKNCDCFLYDFNLK